MKIRGTAESLHGAYKAAQNVMEYASGIATRTAEMVCNARTVASNVVVAVTRKHFPGGKELALHAAMAGGASPHRLGLYDSILVFDQHRVFLSPEEVGPMIAAAARRFPEKKIVMEAATLEEATSFAAMGAHVIQCEQFDPLVLSRCVAALKEINPTVVVAAAGGIRGDNAGEYAATGVDVLVTSWPYFGRPVDFKMSFERRE